MSEIAATNPKRERPASTAYVVGWLAAAGLALGYITLVAAQPELAAQFTPSLKSLELQASADESEAEAQGDVPALRKALAQAQLDAAKARTELKLETERVASLASRMAALEGPKQAAAAGQTSPPPAAGDKVSMVPEPAAPAPAAEPAPKLEVKRIAVVPTPETEETAAVVAAPAKVAAKSASAAASDIAETMAAQPSANGSTAIETGSIAAAAPAAAPAPVTFGRALVKHAPQAAKPVGLKIANSTSVDALRLTWGLLNERHGSALKTLKPRYINGGSSAAPSYDLMAGPVKNAAEARRMCGVLAAKGISCSVGNYDGNAL